MFRLMMMALFAVMVVLESATADAASEKRVALVIGNGAYQSTELKKLTNPPHDAEDVTAALRGFGFEVLSYKNLDRRRMKDAVAEFGRKAVNADAALFYFAGHGIQIKNQNYLMPVDAAVRSEADIADEGINVNYPLEEMENARTRVNLVMLDACRNNDFSGKFRNSGKRGLAAPESMPKGTVIVYATEPGNVASDGTGRNGLFTEGLLTAFKDKDLSLDAVLTSASEWVEKKSGNKQIPYVNGPQTLKKNFYFIFKAPATVNVQTTVADPEAETWSAAQSANTEAAYRVYVEAYPKGRYIAAARIKLEVLKKPAPQKPAAETPPRTDSALPPQTLPTGQIFRDCPDCPEMVVIPAGSFEMGSPSSEIDRDNDEGPQHRVTIAKPFALAKHEVTVGEFRAFVSATGYRTDAEKDAGGKQGCFAWEDGKWDWRSGKHWDNPGFSQSASQPVACISWNDARAYVKWLAGKTGKGYRLPSESEWEYAARAGTQTARYWGDNPDEACTYANVADQTKSSSGHSWSSKHNCTDGYWFSAPVGSFRPNVFGLYDMLGNVWEWTEDCGNDSYNDAPTDGSAWTSGNCGQRVLRGGSWDYKPRSVRAANRIRNGTSNRNVSNGFRPARMLP